MLSTSKMCTLLYRVPFGVLEVVASERGISKVNCKPLGEPSMPSAPGNMSRVCQCRSAPCKASGILDEAGSWLGAYFNGDRFAIGQLPRLDLTEVPEFSTQVLNELVSCTEPGVTITYGGLGEKLGRAKAARAVGNAMRSNPIPLFIPCHRVTLSNGSLGNYSMGHGSLTKEWLLEHEKKMSRDNHTKGKV